MSDKSGIQWTTSTWNPVTGCSKVSQGCKNCYALRDWPRLSAPRPKPNVYTGREFTDVMCHPERLDQPLRWTKPRRVFVNSMSDLFHESVPDEFISLVFHKMELCSTGKFPASGAHTFQVLTKRPQRMRDFMLSYAEQHMGPPTNVWLGVSVEDQATADERIRLLLQTPAAVRFVSYEPALGPVDFSRWLGARNEETRRGDLSACPVREVDDRRSGSNLARDQARGEPHVSRIFAGSSDDYGQAAPCTGSSPGLSPLPRTDTGRTDDQSHERNEGRQQSCEPGTRHVLGAADSCDEGVAARTDRSGGREERNGQDHARDSFDHQIKTSSGRAPQVDSSGLRYIRPNSIEDRSRPTLDWTIVGGESGPKARPCDIAWIRSTVEQCKAAGVPCFVKQLGAHPQEIAFPLIVSDEEARRWMADGWTRIADDDGEHWRRYYRLNDRKGGDMAEWPEDLRVREFPR